MDDMGKVKYFIGAQVDVTGLIEEGRGIESFRSLLHRNAEGPQNYSRKQHMMFKDTATSKPLRILKELSQMFSRDEVEVVRQNVRDSDLSDSSKVDSKFSQKEESIHSSSALLHHGASTRQTRRIRAELSDHSSMAHIANQLSIGSESPCTYSTGYSNIPSLPGPYKHVSSPLSITVLSQLQTNHSNTVSPCPPISIAPNHIP